MVSLIGLRIGPTEQKDSLRQGEGSSERCIEIMEAHGTTTRSGTCMSSSKLATMELAFYTLTGKAEVHSQRLRKK